MKRVALERALAYSFGRDYAVAGLTRAQVIQNLRVHGYGRISQARVLRGYDDQARKG